MAYVKKEYKPNKVQLNILSICYSSSYFEKVTVEDQARKLVKRGLLERVEGPVSWRRYYKTTRKGEAIFCQHLQNRGAAIDLEKLKG